MAKLPVLPLAVAAGAALFLFSRKKPSTPGAEVEPEDEDDSQSAQIDPSAIEPILPGETGERCDTGVPGQYGAVDEKGECKVFYDTAQHDAFLRQTIREVWQELGPPDICDGEPSVLKFPGTGLEEWVVNPNIERIAVESLRRFYGGVSAWPPVEDSPHWVHVTWGIAVYATGSELCGWETII